MDGAYLLRDVASGQAYAVPMGRTIAGRSEEAGLLFDHESLSRNHAAFIQEQNALWVEDLQSSNGTFVEGTQVHGILRLRPGDTIHLGAVLLKVELAAGAAPPAAPPARPSAGDVLRATQKLASRPLTAGNPLRAPTASPSSSGQPAKRKTWLPWALLGLLGLAIGLALLAVLR